MVKRTAFGRLALGALAAGGTLLAVGGAAAAFETKQGFECRIEVPGDNGPIPVDTLDSAKVCADTFVSINCRAQLTPEQNPGVLTISGADAPCEISGIQCGVEDRFDATKSTLKIDANGIARLNCLYRLPPP